MTYFTKFPLIDYNGVQVRDITRSTRIKVFLKSNISFFEPYRVIDGETPESLANDFYGDAQKHWILLLVNDIIDPFYDWVLEDIYLKQYITKKYGSGNENNIHHYELNGIVVPSTEIGAVAITNTEYEETLNEERRDIKIVRPEYIGRIESELEDRLVE